MNLDSCFDFINGKEIRLRGTRIGIETVIRDFLSGTSPEEIALRYRSLGLPQVYAAITYYLHNREQIDALLAACDRADKSAEQRQCEHPSTLVMRLRAQRDDTVASARG
jgi:uncharacterized protein (DUF433 family)